jgi:hypothetical protein
VAELVEASSQAISIFDGIVGQATAALFESYGLPLQQAETKPAKALVAVQLLSTIGFTSQYLSGSLSLVMPDAVAASVRPTPSANLEDWSGELANQLLGRLKNQLLGYQVVINMGLPVVVVGGSVRLPASSRQISRMYEFGSNLGQVFVRLDIEMSPTLELVQASDEARIAHVDEGDLLMF